ncbi:MAG: DUF4113 domain-containing protein, partial [Candidatus Tectomicrobia bacterium]
VDLSVAHHRDDALAMVPVRDIWGIGASYNRLLQNNGIRTALELREASDRWIRQQMGVVGLRIVRELQGISCLPLERRTPPKKSLCVSRSFGNSITSLDEMRQAVATYTTRAGEKLRREGLSAGILTVFLRTNPFNDEPQYHNAVTMPLPVATSDTAELLTYALRGIEQIFRQAYRYKKAGVLLTGLVPTHQIQTHLFDTRDRQRSQRLMTAIDDLNAQMGAGTVHYAATGRKQRWQMRCARRSPRYTTKWNELAAARAIITASTISDTTSVCCLSVPQRPAHSKPSFREWC